MKRRFTLAAAIAMIGLASPSWAQCDSSGTGGGGPGPSTGGPVNDGGSVTGTPVIPGAPTAGPTQGPGTPGPSAPGVPTTPGKTICPPTGIPRVAGAPGAGPSAPTTGVPVAAADTTTWRLWWDLNRDRYLDLRPRVWRRSASLRDEYFVGRESKPQATLPGALDRELKSVVPVLIGILASKESPANLAASAAIALGEIGEETPGFASTPSEEALIAGLAHRDLVVAENAVIALGVLARPTSVRVLEHILSDCGHAREMTGRASVPQRMRSYAAYSLGLIGEGSKNEEARRLAVSNLVQCAEQASSEDLQVACVSGMGLNLLRARAVVGNAQRPASSRESLIAWLLVCFEDPRTAWTVRAHTATALGRLTPESGPLRSEVAKQLLDVLGTRNSRSPEVERAAVLALGEIGDADMDAVDESIRQGLTKVAVRSAHRTTRNFAWISLAQIAGRPGRGEGDPLAALPEIQKALRSTISHGKGGTSEWAALALGMVERATLERGKAPAVASGEVLRHKFAKARQPEELSAYALALGLCRDVESIELMRERFAGTSDDSVRSALAIALGLCGAREAIPELRALVEDAETRPGLIQEASIALALLEDERVVSILIDSWIDAKNLAERAAIANALGRVGDARAVPPLLTLARDEQAMDAARAVAVRALGRVGERRTLPWSSQFTSGVNYLAASDSLPGYLARR